MGLFQKASGDYRSTIAKGRLYRCPCEMPLPALLLARPLYDYSPDEDKIAADIYPMAALADPFNHKPFALLKLKSDEEFGLVKLKYRMVISLSIPTSSGLVRVAPIYTWKSYHANDINKDQLKAGGINGMMYLPPGMSGKNERFISLYEARPIQAIYLEPKPYQLIPNALAELDDKQLDMIVGPNVTSSE